MTDNTTIVDMRQFVQAKDGQPFTTSQRVAEAFGKQHHHVMQKLDALDCSDQFLTSNFSRVQFEHRGNSYDAAEMTKDGFMFLVMGFTGKKAAAIKEGYIAAFNWMAEQLGINSTDLVGAVIGSSGLIVLDRVIDQKAGAIEKSLRRSFKHTIKSRLRGRFNVQRAELIPAENLADACNFVAAYALEGEWLGKGDGQNGIMTEEDLYRVFVLTAHFDAVYEIFRRYNMYDSLKHLGSRAGIEMIDHFKDGSCMSYVLRKRYGQAMDNYRRRLGLNQYRAATMTA